MCMYTQPAHTTSHPDFLLDLAWSFLAVCLHALHSACGTGPLVAILKLHYDLGLAQTSSTPLLWYLGHPEFLWDVSQHFWIIAIQFKPFGNGSWYSLDGLNYEGQWWNVDWFSHEFFSCFLCLFFPVIFPFTFFPLSELYPGIPSCVGQQSEFLALCFTVISGTRREVWPALLSLHEATGSSHYHCPYAQIQHLSSAREDMGK
jgi:hypothetical protein